MSEQKFCCNCKWFGSIGALSCSRPISDELHPVWGTQYIRDSRNPLAIRKDDSGNACGPSAQFYEQRYTESERAAMHEAHKATVEMLIKKHESKPVDQQTYEKHRRKVLGEMNRNIVLVGVGCASVFLLGSALLSILLK